jgi:hypothetical protein
MSQVLRALAQQQRRSSRCTGSKPLQVYSADNTALAVHGTTYSRLYDAEVLQAVRDAVPDFTPPPKGIGGATGLYAGEQDMFAFGIDPNAWVEIGVESFAPGFFVWNSEVARRYENAGDRLVLDQKAATLLSLAA